MHHSERDATFKLFEQTDALTFKIMDKYTEAVNAAAEKLADLEKRYHYAFTIYESQEAQTIGQKAAHDKLQIASNRYAAAREILHTMGMIEAVDTINAAK